LLATDVPTDVYIAIPAGVAIALISGISWYLYKKKGGKDEPPPPMGGATT